MSRRYAPKPSSAARHERGGQRGGRRLEWYVRFRDGRVHRDPRGRSAPLARRRRRACRAGRRGARDLPRDRLLPAGRARRARRVPASVLRASWRRSSPCPTTSRRRSTSAARATSAAGSASVPSSPTTASTTASSSTCPPSTRRTRPTPSRRTCVSTARTSGCPRRSAPGLPRRRRRAVHPSRCRRRRAARRAVGRPRPRPTDHLRVVFGERPLSFAKLIRYPPTPAGEAGVNAHHDAGFLTLLMQHGVGGLRGAQPGRRVDRRAAARRRVRRQHGRDAPGDDRQLRRGHHPPGDRHRATVLLRLLPRPGPAHPAGPRCRSTSGSRWRWPPAPATPAPGSWPSATSWSSGRNGIASSGAGVYGQQLWNYYLRSYPDNVRAHYPTLID